MDNINEENTIEVKKKNKSLALFINILAITLLVTGGYGVKFTLDQQRDIEEARIKQQELLASQQKHAEQLKKEQQEKIRKQKEENKVNEYRNFTKLKEQNKDTIGWLTVPGTDIDISVVKTKDNSYYLTHNFDKEYNSMGWIFADYHNTFPNLSTNTIIYGHTYKDTTMFSSLKKVLKKKWLNKKEQQFITFDTEKERLTFEVFSVYTIKTTSDYLYISFSSPTEYQKYLNKSLERSIKDFEVIPTTNDKIITLSTCYKSDYSERLVVQGILKESN